MRTPFIEGQQPQQVRNELAKVAPLDEARTSVQSVSPTIALQTASTALLATVVASLAIMIFIWWSFRKAEHSFRYSVCAIIAMIHDVLVAAGLTALFSILFNWEMTHCFSRPCSPSSASRCKIRSWSTTAFVILPAVGARPSR